MTQVVGYRIKPPVRYRMSVSLSHCALFFPYITARLLDAVGVRFGPGDKRVFKSFYEWISQSGAPTVRQHGLYLVPLRTKGLQS
jgi:hypothetical protein